MSSLRVFRAIGNGLLLAAASAGAQSPSRKAVTAGDIPVVSQVAWPTYCGSPARAGQPTGHSPIDRDTASWLALSWKIQLEGPIASAPGVWGPFVYVGDWSGKEWAINCLSGAVAASADLGRTRSPQCNPSVIGITSSPAISNGRLYLAGGDDSFYALDAFTLAVAWKTSLGDNSADGGYYGWSSPAVVGGRVLQGVASNCDYPFVPGRLVQLDGVTGAITAEAAFVPKGQVGNGIWTSPAIDLERGEALLTTASGPDVSSDLYAAVVRLSLATFKILDRWKYPVSGPDWDADWGSSPTLFDDGRGRKLVGAGHKDGNYYAFDRLALSSGPLWSAPIARGGAIPESGDGTLSTAAFDGTWLYVGGGVPPDVTDPAVHGSVVALAPADGRIVWRQLLPGPIIAPISTVNGVVFAAGGDLVAGMDSSSGRILWSFRTAGNCYGGVAIAGRHIFFGDLSGALYGFSLP